MIAILRKELKTYYCSLFTYVYYMIFFLVAGILFSNNCLDTASTEFGYSVFRYCIFVVIIIIPFCTMRVFSQERKLKTDQMLFTAPVSVFSILTGKYLATAVYVLTPVVLSLAYPLFISSYGPVNLDFLFCAYLGGLLLTLAVLSVGMFVSTLTSNSILSAVIMYILYIAVLMGRVFEQAMNGEGTVYYILHEFSLYNKYYDMISGIVRSGDILFFLIVMLAFFLLAWISLLHHRVSKKRTLSMSAVVFVIAAVLSAVCIGDTKVYDFTPEKLLVLSEETKNGVSEIPNETVIYYMGNKSQANATYVELLSAYEKLSDNLYVEYIPLDDVTFRQLYLAELPSINEASLVVMTQNRYVYLDSEDYVSVTQTSKYSYERMLEIENQLTSAIIYTNADEIDTLVYTTGHGETALGAGVLNTLGLSQFEAKSINIEDESYDIASTTVDDAKALLINSPQEDFSAEDIAQLETYLANGGRLFVFLDALNEELDNLYQFLSKYGLNVLSGVVIENTEGYYVLDTEYYLMPKIKECDYTKEILKKNLSVVTYTSKGIARYGEGNGYAQTDILVTSDAAFSKLDNFEKITSKGEDDISGPFAIAAVSQNENAGCIFLMTSDIFLSETANEETGGANSRFFVEMVKELTGNNGSVWIEGKDVNSQTAHYPRKMVSKAKFFSIVLIPVVILVFGILILIMRKKNMGWKLIEKRRCKKENIKKENIKKENINKENINKENINKENTDETDE